MNLNYFALITVLAAQVSVVVPNGYRFPDESDYFGDWKLFRVERPTPFLVKADFNGDALPDEAWLLPAVSRPGWALFVFLGAPKGPHRVIRLEVNRETDVQGWGIDLAEPGEHKTACGKGYWECEREEPEVLKLKLPALEFFRFESASSIFWWDPRSARFRRTWLTD